MPLLVPYAEQERFSPLRWKPTLDPEVRSSQGKRRADKEGGGHNACCVGSA